MFFSRGGWAHLQGRGKRKHSSLVSHYYFFSEFITFLHYYCYKHSCQLHDKKLMWWICHVYNGPIVQSEIRNKERKKFSPFSWKNDRNTMKLCPFSTRDAVCHATKIKWWPDHHQHAHVQHRETSDEDEMGKNITLLFVEFFLYFFLFMQFFFLSLKKKNTNGEPIPIFFPLLLYNLFLSFSLFCWRWYSLEEMGRKLY